MTRSLIPWRTRVPETFRRFEDEMERMFDRFVGGEENGGTFPVLHQPRVNIAETGTHYEVTVDLPGLKPEEVNVELKDGDLWITGERKEEKEEKGKTYHTIERRYGQFRRVVGLPTSVDPEKVDAQYKDGVLRVHVAKTDQAKPRKIEVKAEK